MSIEYFKAKIECVVKKRNKDLGFDNHINRDFMDAVLSIDNAADATWFYEGALEWDAEQQGAYKLDEIIEGVQQMVLLSLNDIENANERSKRRAMWHDIFGTYDDLIKQKVIVNG